MNTPTLKLPSSMDEESSHDLWLKFHPGKRASVLVLLYPGESPELGIQTVLTKRSRRLKTSPGMSAFPGGKVDTDTETEWDCALREAYEEIGFDAAKHKGFQRLAVLGCYMSYNAICVRPCIGWLPSGKDICGQLEQNEVEYAFGISLLKILKADPWYLGGTWMNVRGFEWIFHDYAVARSQIQVIKGSSLEDENEKVVLQGLTAHMILDIAIMVHPEITPDMEVLDMAVGNEIATAYSSRIRKANS